MAPRTEHLRCEICTILKHGIMAHVRHLLSRSGGKNVPRDVPPGHLAVIVGEAAKRYVIKADYLNYPVFKQLLDQAYEKYGHQNSGPLAFPCDEHVFADLIHYLSAVTSSTHSPFSRRKKESYLGVDSWRDLAPLLRSFVRRSVHERQSEKNVALAFNQTPKIGYAHHLDLRQFF